MSRNTKAKKEILHYIEHAGRAMAHGEIYENIEQGCDRVTVYRVLERLVQEKLAHRIVNTDGVVYYAACSSCMQDHHHRHVHFSCENCKTVSCLNEIEPMFKLPVNYLVHQINFTLSGICPRCR